LISVILDQSQHTTIIVLIMSRFSVCGTATEFVNIGFCLYTSITLLN